MERDFFDPIPEQQNVVLVDAATLRKAERMIECCEYCNPDGAEISRAERRNDDPVMISRNIDVLSGYGVPAQAILSKINGVMGAVGASAAMNCDEDALHMLA